MPSGFLIAGVSPHLLLDEDYRGFLELTASHIAGSLANVRAYEEERRRAEALANATVLTVMIAQGPRAGGHVPAVRYTGSVLGELRFEAAHSSLHDALNF